MDLSPALIPQLVALAVLLAISAFFSLSETALIGVSRLKVRQRAEEGDHKARLVDHMLNEPERIISTVLVGNNIMNISAASLGTVVAAQIFNDNPLLIATVAMTLLVLIFTEITPKTIAVQHPLAVARLVARPLRLVEALLKPVITVVSALSRGLMRLVGIKTRSRTPFITSDEVEVLVRMGVEQGGVEQFEQRVISELFAFTETDVHKVMTPAERVHYVPKDAKLSDAAALLSKSGRTRVLVVEGGLDHVLGCVHARDLLKYTDQQLESLPVTVALRGVLFASAKLLAVIQDAHGRNLGICTVEDLLEELVGEIHDEFDRKPAEAKLETSRPLP
jgi:CBS domain containing-hemolysin-like protein